VGAELVARANNDGYTLVLGTIASHGIGTLMFPVRYDPVKDFQPITLIANSPNLLVVHRSIPVATPAQLIEYAKKAGASISRRLEPQPPATLPASCYVVKQAAPLSHVAYRQGVRRSRSPVGTDSRDDLAAAAVEPHIASGAVQGDRRHVGGAYHLVSERATISETLIAGFDSNAWFWNSGAGRHARPSSNAVSRDTRRAGNRLSSSTSSRLQGLEPAAAGLKHSAGRFRRSGQVARGDSGSWRQGRIGRAIVDSNPASNLP
jgi:hypothetical protein